jgi:L-alanine-DL-glutamate epimerase-like enolase superfamily enzyme
VKITNVSAQSIRIPLECSFYNADDAGTKREWGRLSRVTPKRPDPVAEYVIVRIETDEGVTGVGEACADIGFFGQTVEQIHVAIADYLGPQLVGGDPFDREKLMHLIDYRENSCAKSGIDLALHDLVGKAKGISASDLIGGSHRDRVKVAIEIHGGAPEDMADACLRYMKQGVRAFKPKIGSDPYMDANRLLAIREAVGPDVSLRADANQGYTVKEAILLCELAEDQGVELELLEQPVQYWDLQGMATVTAAVSTLVEADESCFTIHDAMQVIRHQAADVLNIKIAKAGGLLNAKKIAALAESAGLQCVLGTAFGLGPKIAAKLHLAASTIGMADAVEFTELGLHGPMLVKEQDDLLSLPLEEDGCLPVPTGPGLGVDLDEERLKEYVV